MIIVAPKNFGDKTVRRIAKYVNYSQVSRGRGTAPNSVLSALGIGEAEKDVIFCFTEKKNVEKIYGVLMNQLDFVQKHLGIAFTVPVSAVGGRLTLDVLSGEIPKFNSVKKGKA